MNLTEAVAHIEQVDPEFIPVLEKAGELRLPKPEQPFEALVNSIVSQQLSTKAAATIAQRVRLALENDIRPEKVLNAPAELLRAAGLSAQKTKYLYALSDAFISNPDAYQNLHELQNQQVIERLTDIKGIGVWTAHMFLMFTLLREDVFPIGDLGIRRGMELFLFDGEKQEHTTLIKRAEVWKPFRSVACLALWKAQD
jgi:DNA-3-methyladenine glycosylase II